MFRGDWVGKLISAVVGAGVVLALLVIGYALGLEHWSKQNDIYYHHKEAAEQQRQHTAQKAADNCEGRSGANLLSCFQEQIAAHDREQTISQDLQAQQEMALWGLWVFIAAALTALLTSAGVYLIWQTLEATKIAADHTKGMLGEAENTTRAAIAASAHAREQVEQARLANDFAKAEAERQFDPYLFVTEATYGPMPENWPGPVSEGDYWAKITIKNGSNWTAFVKKRTNRSFIFKNGMSIGGGGGGGWGVTSELKPGETTTVEFGGDDPGIPPVVQSYFGIRIEYDTVDGRPRHKDFWLRKAHEYGDGWWLDRLDGIPEIVADLPASMRSIWGTGDGPTTREQMDDHRRYYSQFPSSHFGLGD